MKIRSHTGIVDCVRRLFRRSNPLLASEALMHHISNTGSGWEIDDLMSWAPSEQQEHEAIQPLLDIHARYKNDQYPIGINNPESFEEIKILITSLKKKGL